jgi:hypothetical protein
VLDRVAAHALAENSWPALVESALSSATFSLLAAEVARRASATPITKTSDAPAPATESLGHHRAVGPATNYSVETMTVSPAIQNAAAIDQVQGRTDGAHARFAQSQQAGTGKCFAEQRTHDYLRENPTALEMVEHLDDLVFDAIAGQPNAFARLLEFWPNALAQLDPAVLAQAREQYLRHGLTVWTGVNAAGVQTPERAITALDVPCLLFPETDFA